MQYDNKEFLQHTKSQPSDLKWFIGTENWLIFHVFCSFCGADLKQRPVSVHTHTDSHLHIPSTFLPISVFWRTKRLQKWSQHLLQIHFFTESLHHVRIWEVSKSVGGLHFFETMRLTYYCYRDHSQLIYLNSIEIIRKWSQNTHTLNFKFQRICF